MTSSRTDGDGALRDLVRHRLRRESVLEDLVVSGALPVAHFGNVRTARAISVGINPAASEFDVHWGGVEPARATRLGTLASVGATRRSDLTDAQCDAAAAKMDGYFSDPDIPTQWFCNLRAFFVGLGYDFVRGTAAHVDVVQEPTRQKWSEIKRDPRAVAQAAHDVSFVVELLHHTQPSWIVLDGATVTEAIAPRLHAQRTQQGVEADAKPSALRWWTGTCRLPSGATSSVVAWNYPLARVTLRFRDFGRRIAATIDGTR